MHTRQQNRKRKARIKRDQLLNELSDDELVPAWAIVRTQDMVFFPLPGSKSNESIAVTQTTDRALLFEEESIAKHFISRAQVKFEGDWRAIQVRVPIDVAIKSKVKIMGIDEDQLPYDLVNNIKELSRDVVYINRSAGFNFLIDYPEFVLDVFDRGVFCCPSDVHEFRKNGRPVAEELQLLNEKILTAGINSWHEDHGREIVKRAGKYLAVCDVFGASKETELIAQNESGLYPFSDSIARSLASDEHINKMKQLADVLSAQGVRTACNVIYLLSLLIGMQMYREIKLLSQDEFEILLEFKCEESDSEIRDFSADIMEAGYHYLRDQFFQLDNNNGTGPLKL